MGLSALTIKPKQMWLTLTPWLRRERKTQEWFEKHMGLNALTHHQCGCQRWLHLQEAHRTTKLQSPWCSSRNSRPSQKTFSTSSTKPSKPLLPTHQNPFFSLSLTNPTPSASLLSSCLNLFFLLLLFLLYSLFLMFRMCCAAFTTIQKLKNPETSTTTTQ